MIAADILGVLFAVLVLALVYLAARRIWAGVFDSEPEPETYGDSGGDPAYALQRLGADRRAGGMLKDWSL